MMRLVEQTAAVEAVAPRAPARQVAARRWLRPGGAIVFALAAASVLVFLLPTLTAQFPSRTLSPHSGSPLSAAARIQSYHPGFAGLPLLRTSVEHAEGIASSPGDALGSIEGISADVGSSTVLELPDVGLLRLDGLSRCRMEGARRVVLEEGELYAQIRPTGRDFCVESAAGVVRVVGTRFRMRVTPRGTLVTVTEGKVSFRNQLGEVWLSAGQRSLATLATAPSPAAGTEPADPSDPETRAALYQDPALDLAIQPAPCHVQSPVTARIRLTNPNSALWVHSLSDAASYYLLNVTRPDGTTFQVRMNAYRPVEQASYPREKGMVLLRKGQSYDVQCALTDLFPSAGTYTLSASYASSNAAGDRLEAWRGVLTTAPVRVEVIDRP
ncbi:MAG: FecR domain-containing protein [Planctomycetes bacterium]|nr:FecR domain-containing protein [Planctomycetota bacterium]